MIKNKKNIPLTILKIIQPYLKSNDSHIKVVDSDKSILKIEDRDPESSFFFELNDFSTANNRPVFRVTYKPRNQNDISVIQRDIEANTFATYFDAWLSTIKEYNEIEIYEDPIINQYKKEFYDDFEIVDDDADFNSFNLNQQLWLDNYLSEISLTISEYVNDDNKQAIEEIKADIKELKHSQSILTKKQVVNSLTKIWAKVRKEGIDLLKAIYVKSKEEIVKQLIKAVTERLN